MSVRIVADLRNQLHKCPFRDIVTERSGDIRYTFRPKGFSRGCKVFFLQIDIAEIIIHKTDQPDAVVDFFDADGLSCERYAEIDCLVVQAKASAAGDHDGAVVEGIVRLWDALIGAAGSRVDLGWAFHGGHDRPNKALARDVARQAPRQDLRVEADTRFQCQLIFAA